MRPLTLLRLALFFVACVAVFLVDGVGAGVAMYRMPNEGVYPPVQRDVVHEAVPLPSVCATNFTSYLLLAELLVVAVAFLLSPKGVPVIVAAGNPERAGAESKLTRIRALDLVAVGSARVHNLAHLVLVSRPFVRQLRPRQLSCDALGGCCVNTGQVSPGHVWRSHV